MKRIYYRAKKKFYIQGSKLFDIGDPSDSMYIVLLGTLEVILSDGNVHQQIDMLGSGSVLGSNYVLVSLQWLYQVKVKSIGAHVFVLDRKIIM